MKLAEMEAPSKTIKRAIACGVQTVEEYNVWLDGYLVGQMDAQSQALEWLTPEWKPETVVHHTNKEG